MAQDPKVIPITIAGDIRRRARQDSAVSSTLPTPLLPIRQRVQEFFTGALTELFDNADDSLFEMADRAASNSEQSLFFEAMRVVRLQRHAIEKACCSNLLRALEALAQAEPAVDASLRHTFALDTLSLVQPDELEQTVALDSMVGRVTARNRQELSHLAVRINSLVKASVDERNNPLGPAQLAQAFVDGYQALNLDIKVRLIILKLFERHVFNRIDGLYEEINRQLIVAGVLPDLKLTGVPQRQPRPGRTPSQSVQSDYPAGIDRPDQQQVLSLFSELIGGWRHASGDTALTGLGMPGATPMPSDELLGMLARLPAEDSAGPAGTPVQGLRTRIQQQLNEQRRQTGEARTLDRVDDDVISLVSMLFDFVLDDPQLPAALKALIGRLQLPILRVAIADKSFFSRSAHPARRLLNELARATMGWSDHDDLRRDQLHALLENIVERLLNEADPTIELFDDLHAELAGFVRVEQRRSERLEQRTRDAEEGKAKVEAARVQVAASLNGLLVGRTLPVLVVDMLRDTWSQVMQMTWLREGADSAAWRQAIDTAERLVLSVEPVEEQELAEREALMAEVRRSLCDGMQLIGQDEQQSAPLLERLALLQQTIVDAARLLVAPVASPAVDAEEESSPPTADPDPQRTDAGVAPVEPVAPAAPPVAEVAPAPVEIEAVQVIEPVLPEPSPPEEPLLVDELPSVSAAVWVESLHTGSWFELATAEGQPVQRCKLAAIISFSGKYIFVNRSGMKVAEYTHAALTQHFDQGLIRLLDDNQLFDRALESVIGNLRRLQASKP